MTPIIWMHGEGVQVYLQWMPKGVQKFTGFWTPLGRQLTREAPVYEGLRRFTGHREMPKASRGLQVNLDTGGFLGGLGVKGA